MVLPDRLQIPVSPVHQPELQWDSQDEDPSRDAGPFLFPSEHIEMDEEKNTQHKNDPNEGEIPGRRKAKAYGQ